MKRLVLFLGITIAASAITWALKAQTKQPPKKTYKVELAIEDWQHVMAAIEMSKAALKRSDLPSKDVVFINDSLFSYIQAAFASQINAQLEAEKQLKPEIKKDTLIKTKKN